MVLALLSFVALTSLPIIAPYSVTNKAEGLVLFVDITLIIFVCTNTPTPSLTVTLPLLFSLDNPNKWTNVSDCSKKVFLQK